MAAEVLVSLMAHASHLCASRQGDRIWLVLKPPCRHGRACPGHPRLATRNEERGCPGQARA
ncbi:hypothetical protein D6B98_25330 [Bradyrhizobium sp. LVM 105]|nr:hypothetical protein D6B98_25330 [Bradyrhizobium sp. LVM 105]